MSTVNAVPGSDPKVGKSRPASETKYPYFDLQTCIDVGRAMHERAGGTCNLAQLATLLSYSGVTNGSFRMKVSSAKQFGIIGGSDKTGLTVTPLGLQMIAPDTDATASRARLAAFMNVVLYKKIYEKYEGMPLPNEAGLRNVMATDFGIVKDRLATAVRVMMDSAEHAGLFEAAGNRSKMVLPFAAAPANGYQTPAAKPIRQDGGSPSVDLGGGGGNGGGATIDPAILGLLQRLPAAGTALSPKRRTALIQAFTATVNFIYPEDPENEG